MNDITKKWNNTGLLDELTDDIQKDECAAILNHTAQILIRNDIEIDDTDKKGKKRHEEFCGFVLPMARRIYDCLWPYKIKFPDVEWFVKDSREFFDKNKELCDDLNSYIVMDGERQMCEMYEQVCLEKMNGQGK